MIFTQFIVIVLPSPSQRYVCLTNEQNAEVRDAPIVYFTTTPNTLPPSLPILLYHYSFVRRSFIHSVSPLYDVCPFAAPFIIATTYFPLLYGFTICFVGVGPPLFDGMEQRSSHAHVGTQSQTSSYCVRVGRIAFRGRGLLERHQRKYGIVSLLCRSVNVLLETVKHIFRSSSIFPKISH